MRYKNRYAPRDGQVTGAKGFNKQPSLNNRTIATAHCFCMGLAFRNIPGVCATCANFDGYLREVGFRRLVGYVGFTA